MASERERAVRKAIEALDRRDPDAYLALASPDIELFSAAASLEGSHAGHDGIRRFFAELESFAPGTRFEIIDVVEVGERVVAFIRVTAVGRESGAGTVAEFANVYGFADGRIRVVRVFTDREQALEAARSAQ